MVSKPSFLVDNENFYVLNTSYIMVSTSSYDLNYLAVLMNSTLLYWLFKHITTSLGTKGLRYIKQYVEQLPIYPTPPEQQKPFIELAGKMLNLNQDLMCEVDGFKSWLKHTFHIEKFSQKLDRYYELSFDMFLLELKKKKIDVNSRKTQQLLKKEFKESVNKITSLQREIKKTDKKIDKMVYELYGLNDEEIQIIENSFKR